MARKKRVTVPQLPVSVAPPCSVCGLESDDLAPDGMRYCGEHDPRTSDQDRAMLKAMRLGAWNPYLRPIF